MPAAAADGSLNFLRHSSGLQLWDCSSFLLVAIDKYQYCIDAKINNIKIMIII